VLARVAAYSAWRTTEREEAAHHDEIPGGIDRAAATDVIDAMLAAGASGPQEVGALLAAYGITMAPTRRVRADHAVEAADAVGYPVAIKADQRRIGRSVEAGVALDLRTADDVTEAVTAMREHLGADADTVNVQPMVSPGVDVRIRVADDERLGPIITVGLGGVQADIIGDEVSRLAPVSPSSGRRMVEATRAAGALDEEELTLVGEIVARVAQLASDHPRIESLDLNPVIVADRHCRVVDASVRLGEADRHEPYRRLDA
jgi:ATP-grasp domain